MTSVSVVLGAVYVGLDYHQGSVQVCVMDASGKILANRSCENIASRIVRFVAAYAPKASVQAAIEACCGAAALTDELIAAGWRVSLAHAGYVHRTKQSPDKTDWGDARLLADLLRVGYLPHVWLPPAGLRQLRDLVRLRQQQAQGRRTAKQRVTAKLRERRIVFAGSRWTKAWLNAVQTCEALGPEGMWAMQGLLRQIAFFEEEIKKTEARLAEVTKDDPFVQKLLEMKGVGLVTAAMLRAEMGEMSRFRSGKQLSKYCGLSPRNASSGTRQADAGLIKTGNPQLRSILVEAAHRLQKFDPRWAALGGQMKARGKPGSLVAAAVANRWVRWLYHQLQGLQAA